MQKYIQVDIYGKCGQLRCPATKERNECKQILSKNYLFYLSFENSNCIDYITEKFFTIIRFNIIPIVMGGGEYDYYVISFRIKSGLISLKSQI